MLRFTGTCNEVDFATATRSADFWYHSFYFDNGFEIRGDYEIGLDVDTYGFSSDLSGLRVLDIGSASGWFSFFFEQLGAEVTAVDLRSETDMDTFGRFLPPTDVAAGWMESFDVMSKLLGSNVNRVRARAYDVSPDLFGGIEFDLVFMGAILLHLRDPIGALMSARSVCRDRLMATNWFLPQEESVETDSRQDVRGGVEHPVADLPALGEQESGRRAWWRPNRAAYALWFRAAGFGTVDVSRTVTLTADVVTPDHYNSTQTLLLADARVR